MPSVLSSPPPVQITQTGVTLQPEALSALREEYAQTGCALFRGFLSQPILTPLMKLVEQTGYRVREEVYGEQEHVFGRTLLAPVSDPARFTILFAVNKPELFRIVEAITGCPGLGNFFGRLHQTRADPDQHIDWHNDLSDTRTVGLNISLSAGEFTGGLFQLRGPGLKEPTTFGRLQPGDAFLFRIDPGWAHRLTPVESGVRTVGVGWFRTSPNREDFAREWFRLPAPPAHAVGTR